MTFPKDSDSISNANLFVESLEDRMMLSTVSIHASGETGQETMNLLVDGSVVATYENVSVKQSVYTYDTDETLSADQLRITFTNDLYEPENGIDRNLTVDRIVVDGQNIESEAPQNFHSGVWNPNPGQIETGFLQAETLHANGYIEYAD